MANVGGAQYRPVRPLAARGNGGAPYRPPAPRVTGGTGLRGPGWQPRLRSFQASKPAVPKPVQLNSSPAPGASPPAAPPSPLDATYYNALAQNQFNANQQIAGINATGANAQTALQENLRQMAVKEPLLEQNATNAANSKGLLYSGALGNQIGQEKTAYTQNQANANQQYAQGQSSRQAQIAAIEGGLPFKELAARLAAIGRSSTAAQTEPLVDQSPVPRAVGHSPAYTGPGQYNDVGPTSTALHAVGHSAAYRGPGKYVAVKAHTRAAPRKGK